MKELADISLFQSITNVKQSTDGNPFVDADLVKKQLEEDRIQQQELNDLFLNNPWNYMGITPDEPNRKVYGRKEFRNYSLEEVVKKAIEFQSKQQYAILNIQMEPDDLKTGNFDTVFYGKTVPALVRYIQRHCKSDKLTRSEILQEIDDPSFFVGRSEDNIVERLGQLAENIRKGSLETIPRFRIFKKHLKPLDKIFRSKISPHNKREARKWGALFAKKLLDLGVPDSTLPELFSSFDLFARLCDSYGVGMENVMRGSNAYIEADPRRDGSYSPATFTFFLKGNTINPETVVHELFHALCARLDTKNTIEEAALFDAELEEEKKEDTPTGDIARWHDPKRKTRTGQDDASIRNYIPNVPGRILSEYFTELISSYLDSNIPQKRQDLLERLGRWWEGLFGSRKITKEWVEDFVNSIKKFKEQNEKKQ